VIPIKAASPPAALLDSPLILVRNQTAGSFDIQAGQSTVGKITHASSTDFSMHAHTFAKDRKSFVLVGKKSDLSTFQKPESYKLETMGSQRFVERRSRRRCGYEIYSRSDQDEA
jgi:hypothetical protein